MLDTNTLAPILEALPRAIMLVDSNGKILYINKRYQELTGIKSTEYVQQNIFNLARDCPLAETLETGKPVTCPYSYYFGNGLEIICTTFPIISQGKQLGALEIAEAVEEYIMPLPEIERQMLIKGLSLYGYSMKGKIKTSQLLNISLATLYNKIKKYNL